jgi:hypothetical protein
MSFRVEIVDLTCNETSLSGMGVLSADNDREFGVLSGEAE